VLHLYYPELWPEFRDALGAIPEPVDLFVTLTVGYSDQAGDWIRIDYPSAQIITFENRGRDILPFVTLINSGLLFRYELICKLHTKRSMHIDHGDDWRCALLGGVLSNDHVPRILTAFDTDPDLGIVVADGSLRDDARSWSKHLGRVGELSNRIGMPAVTAESGYPKFPAGSIFWVRSSLLRPIACLRLTPAEFEPEPIPPNACMPHAIERLVGHLCREVGKRVAESGDLNKADFE
jgi:lipopolysaccharide biosynthesis protein